MTDNRITGQPPDSSQGGCAPAGTAQAAQQGHPGTSSVDGESAVHAAAQGVQLPEPEGPRANDPRWQTSSAPMPEWMQRLRDVAPTSKDILHAQGLADLRRAEEASLEREKLRAQRAGIEVSGPDGAPRQIVVRALDKVQMRAIDWLWTGWIPQGYITILAGETGAAKTTVLADVAARVTTGKPWPGEPDSHARLPGRVLWLGSEDGIEDMTVPRLVACGADLSRILVIDGVLQQGTRNTFSMQDDLAAVKAGLNEARNANAPFSLLVIDPVTSYLPGRRLRKVDLNDAGQLRSVLEPWLALAQEYNLAIVCVTHFMKDTTRAMLHRVLGSAAFAQTCRSLCAVVARTDDGQYAKALVQVKVNLPEHPGGAWLFETRKTCVAYDPVSSKPINATHPVWHDLDAMVTPESLVGGTRGPVSEYPAAFGMWVRAFFMTTPPDQGIPTADVKRAALEAKVVTARWWDDHSNEYLDKRNVGGVWMCRPKQSP